MVLKQSPMPAFASVVFRGRTPLRERRKRKLFSIAFVVALIWVGMGDFAQAQTVSAPWGASTPYSSPGSVTSFTQSVTTSQAKLPEGMMLPIGLWAFYPTLLVGGVYTDNVFRSPFTKVAAPGVRVNPTLVASRGNGIHTLRLFGSFDGVFYPGVMSGNTYGIQSDGTYIWEIRRDLVFQLRGGLQRSIGAYANLNALSNSVTFAPTPATLAATSQYINQYRGSATLEKTFNHLTAALAASVSRLELGANNNSATGQQSVLFAADQQQQQNFNSLLNSTTYAATGRLGYALTTSAYVYVQATGNQIKYDSTFRNSAGYSAIVGIGSDRISLFRGEIYGGYGQQFYDDPQLGKPALPLLGGRIEYLPTPLLTLSLAFARSMVDYASTPVALNRLVAASASTAATTASSASSATTTLVGSATYSFSERLGGAANVGYQSDTLGYNRRLAAGGKLTYNITRNLDMALDYQHTRALLVVNNPFFGSGAFSGQSGATATGQGVYYTENRVSLSVTYKF